MTRLPMISGRECVKALQRAGFEVMRQKGSHIVLQHTTSGIMVVVPAHDELDRGTLKSILRQANMDADKFVQLL